MIVYHPPCLVVGVGCNRNTAAAEIDAAIEQTLADAGLEPLSVDRIATIEDKANEAGLLAVAETRAWPVTVFTREEIRSAGEMPNPSEWAQARAGCAWCG